jgi:IS30 family transposase
MTNDNGREFGRDDVVQRKLGAPIYFTEPSAPWQRAVPARLNRKPQRPCPSVRPRAHQHQRYFDER